MSGSRSSNDPEHKSPRESGEDSEDESEILEESPCGRWLKRREEHVDLIGDCSIEAVTPAHVSSRVYFLPLQLSLTLPLAKECPSPSRIRKVLLSLLEPY
ncbi:hypothetical protein C0J52_04881 [Blattella germanica]|nr:hypothetical protein C0J52_04881 [Blattella germanica]